MFAEYFATAEWSHEQWLAATILAFIVVTVLVVLHRMYRLFQATQKTRYQPNLRPLRRRRRVAGTAERGNE